jgi:hypothetical protein
MTRPLSAYPASGKRMTRSEMHVTCPETGGAPDHRAVIGLPGRSRRSGLFTGIRPMGI